MLRNLKLGVLRLAQAAGVQELVARSRWRRQRLLILCYHGISLDEEHLWRPNLYLDPALFRQRLEYLRGGGYSVLGLDEGLRRLREGSLPPKAVCLTFDDGFVDFLEAGYPLLATFGMPATVYLTTWYAGRGEPVFGLMTHYLLWKARGQRLDLSPLVSGARTVHLDTPRECESAAAAIVSHARRDGRSHEDRQALLWFLADRLEVDYSGLLARRVLQIMSANEVARLSPLVATVELHTHRHRVPMDPVMFTAEVEDNRAAIRAMRPRQDNPVHFCYPSGVHAPEMLPWLRAAGVQSATTCEPGIASPADEPLLLPRLLDGHNITWQEFSGWAGGLSALLPRRRPKLTAS